MDRAQVMIDFWNRAVRAKMDVGDDWRWCRLEAIGSDNLVTGGVPRALKSGPKKGQLTWRGVETQQCVVTRAELRATQEAWERETSNCYDCCGEGRTTQRAWKNADGQWERGTLPCKRCSGTGKAP